MRISPSYMDGLKKRIAEQDAQIAALQERVHLCAAYDALMRESETLKNVSAIVDEQAEDYGLWFVAHTAPEAYLQKALRRLHAAVEGDK